ncbi:hypothetical protein [Methylobacterium platani]|uniref:Uncharacterized protein n=2 Tax=Methylobacterium platani TaxID=427683 RepID=A0A179SIB1_9HYPH|nr:hypothetical protein [Methylobacterium platani]KMO14770.1 hypothetical protein SQ03_18625 [Methylobacterium platani JCM 14648]OAS27219.1 hypothetical protein A5481_01985 [Methylobacterium platani]
MPDFESRNLDDTEGLACLAELLHPTKAAQTEAKARGRRRAAAGFLPAKEPAPADPEPQALQHA